ncbi:CHAT domain-containing protein [Microcoleus sp. N3A4]|uniref:CHAT domain-containing tetratricopeptide repeat protein n=1 Tax=Microcoleus sp. N3A4 TaxID=3055379 RepID=UPI002FCED623
MRQRLFNGDHPDVAASLNSLAVLYYCQGKYRKAEPLFQQALEMRQRLFNGDHPDVAASLNNLAGLYLSQGKYREAEILYQQALGMNQRQALGIWQRLFKGGRDHLAISLNNLARLYDIQGKYREAEPFYQQALGILQSLVKGDHPDLATSLNNLANLYLSQGKYREAEDIFQQALEMNQRLFSGDHPNVATSLNNLAGLYDNQGKYREAEPLFQQVLEMRQRLFSGDHSDVAASLNNLAGLYYIQGKYRKTEPLLQQALEMNQRLFNGDHPDIANSLNNLAELYYIQGKYRKTEPLFQQALEMNQRLFNSDHPGIANSLNNLALLYKKQGKYREAENLFQQVLEMRQRLFNSDHPDIANSLNSLALLYKKQGKYREAEPLFIQALAIKKRLFNGDHQDVAISLSNLAVLYCYQGKYREAEPLFQQALEMRQRLFNGDHLDIATSLNNLATLYAVTNRHQQALELFKEATEIEHSLMSQEFVGSSENDRILFLDSIRVTQYALLSLIYQYFYPLEESEEKSQAIHTAFDLVLKRKALSNAASAAFNTAMYSDRYPHLKDSFERWRSRWQQIINLQFSLYLPKNLPRLEANKKILSELHIEVEDLEKNITVPELCLENQLVDRKAIALELPENSTLIEFVYFPVFDFTTNQYQNPRYLAFILPAQQPEKVQMIDLGKADKIDDLIGKVRQAVSQINLENMGISTKTWKSEKAESENHFFELTNTIFKPLQNHLQGQELFICPDGALTLIPFEILPLDPQNNQLLIEQYQITYLTAGRDLLRYKYQPKNCCASESLVIADPNFDLSINQAIAIPPISVKKEGLSLNFNTVTNEIIETLGKEDSKPFSPVPMTQEIAEVAASQFKVNPLLQNDALKNYLANGKCPQKLVIATHGFFLPQNAPPQPDFLTRAEFIQAGFHFRQIQTIENPLLRSGLALAGANTWLLGGEIHPEAGEGIIFAQDVAGFDLWANELIILIACETAVGDVKIGEGVKGLRSAFTAAGARLLIMSLWSVPAQVSILLMNRFFVNYQEKNLRCQQALQEAQNYIRTLTRKELESLPNGQKIIQEIRSTLREKSPQLVEQWELQNNPLQARYFWGAWVCVGREF